MLGPEICNIDTVPPRSVVIFWTSQQARKSLLATITDLIALQTKNVIKRQVKGLYILLYPLVLKIPSIFPENWNKGRILPRRVANNLFWGWKAEIKNLFHVIVYVVGRPLPAKMDKFSEKLRMAFDAPTPTPTPTQTATLSATQTPTPSPTRTPSPT